MLHRQNLHDDDEEVDLLRKMPSALAGEPRDDGMLPKEKHPAMVFERLSQRTSLFFGYPLGTAADLEKFGQRLARGEQRVPWQTRPLRQYSYASKEILEVLEPMGVHYTPDSDAGVLEVEGESGVLVELLFSGKVSLLIYLALVRAMTNENLTELHIESPNGVALTLTRGDLHLMTMFLQFASDEATCYGGNKDAVARIWRAVFSECVGAMASDAIPYIRFASDVPLLSAIALLEIPMQTDIMTLVGREPPLVLREVARQTFAIVCAFLFQVDAAFAIEEAMASLDFDYENPGAFRILFALLAPSNADLRGVVCKRAFTNLDVLAPLMCADAVSETSRGVYEDQPFVPFLRYDRRLLCASDDSVPVVSFVFAAAIFALPYLFRRFSAA